MSVYTDSLFSLIIEADGDGLTAMESGQKAYCDKVVIRNGLPIDTREPGECAGWQEMVARARRDIERGRLVAKRDEIAAQLTTEQITQAREAIEKWERSLQQPLMHSTGF